MEKKNNIEVVNFHDMRKAAQIYKTYLTNHLRNKFNLHESAIKQHLSLTDF